jgi:ribosomal protein S1
VVDSPVDAAVSLILQPSQVIELQMQLDEYKEKYKAIARSTNIKAQLKRAQMLEYNMSQMEDSQRRVRASLHHY